MKTVSDKPTGRQPQFITPLSKGENKMQHAYSGKYTVVFIPPLIIDDNTQVETVEFWNEKSALKFAKSFEGCERKTRVLNTRKEEIYSYQPNNSKA